MAGCEHGGLLRLANRFGDCRMTRAGQAALSTGDPLIALDTQAGEVVEFSWITAPQ